ncbi:glycoside hydrolase family 130 protein [Penicillium chermesinum]|nr:glycoside hydrolase family 130 protein [Penicillium chermesinum]
MISSIVPLPLLATVTTASNPSKLSSRSSSKVPPITPESTENERNPILSPNPTRTWESAYLYNPTAIVIDDLIWMLSRPKQLQNLLHRPHLVPQRPQLHPLRAARALPTEPYETPGGCDDPRVVHVNGTFYMTYTGYTNTTARLCLATSPDLVHWTKHGPILPAVQDVLYQWRDPLNAYVPLQGWSKSGAILNEPQPDGTYRMIYGESFLYQANSTDLLSWNSPQGGLPNAGKLNPWEPGPPAIRTRDGRWILFYNGGGDGAWGADECGGGGGAG